VASPVPFTFLLLFAPFSLRLEAQPPVCRELRGTITVTIRVIALEMISC
jgi:hypothetical protein